MGSLRQYLDQEVRSQLARWSNRLVVYYLYQRHDHGARQSWMDHIDYPDPLPVSTISRASPLRYLTVSSSGTLLCLSPTPRTPSTNASRPEERNDRRLTP